LGTSHNFLSLGVTISYYWFDSERRTDDEDTQEDWMMSCVTCTTDVIVISLSTVERECIPQ